MRCCSRIRARYGHSVRHHAGRLRSFAREHKLATAAVLGVAVGATAATAGVLAGGLLGGAAAVTEELLLKGDRDAP